MRVQPCYGLEALFYYLMFACVILVQQRIFGDESRQPEIFALTIAVAGVLIFVAELLCSRMQAAGGMYLISTLTEVMKWLTACYLFFRSIRYIQQKYSNILLVGIVVYGTSLAADRIWKLYGSCVQRWADFVDGTCKCVSFPAFLWRIQPPDGAEASDAETAL